MSNLGDHMQGNNNRENAENSSGLPLERDGGHNNIEGVEEQVLIPADILESILRQQQQLNDTIRALTQPRGANTPRVATGGVTTRNEGDATHPREPVNLGVENEVEEVLRDPREKESVRPPRSMHTPPAPSTEYLTKEDVLKLLESKKECVADIDFRPPYPQWVAAKPYPEGYQPPQFRKFDGEGGNAKEHVMCFIDDLGVYGQDKELRLREFSKSLTGKAYTWYTKLSPESIHSWEEMARAFCEKFYESQAIVHVMDLGRIIQRPEENTIYFIKRYRDMALKCKEPIPEVDLVYGCVTNMDASVRLFLEQAKIQTFAELMERAQRTMLSMHKDNKKRSREKGVPLMPIDVVEGPRPDTSTQRGIKKQHNRVPLPTSYKDDKESKPRRKPASPRP